MIEYAVEVTDAAFVAIRRHARYIAVDSQAPENAKRWLERVWDAVDSTCRTAFNWASKRRYLPPYAEYPFSTFPIRSRV